jgi:hypothetical protein
MSLSYQHRQLTCDLTRDILGLFTSATLSIFKPWLLLSAVYNVICLGRHIRSFRELRKSLKTQGIRVRFREKLKGFFEGLWTKLVTTVLTVGHDDFVKVIGMLKDGHLLNDFSSTKIQDMTSWHGDKHLKDIADTVDTPANDSMKRVGVDKETRELGWHGSEAAVANEVAVGGVVTVGVEIAAKYCLEKPHDAARDRLSRNGPKSVWTRESQSGSTASDYHRSVVVGSIKSTGFSSRGNDPTPEGLVFLGGIMFASFAAFWMFAG